MSHYESEEKEALPLDLDRSESKQEENGNEGFDSAKAEQMDLFGNKSVEEIGSERIGKAVEVGRRTFGKVSGFFKSMWNKSGLERVASYAAAPDQVVKAVGQEIGDQVGRASEKSDEIYSSVTERIDGVAAGADSFIDRAKDSILSKYAEKIGLRDKMNVPKIKSPEARSTILGLSGPERSMGGELIVGSTIFDRVKDFAGQMRSIRAQYEL